MKRWIQGGKLNFEVSFYCDDIYYRDDFDFCFLQGMEYEDIS